MVVAWDFVVYPALSFSYRPESPVDWRLSDLPPDFGRAFDRVVVEDFVVVSGLAFVPVSSRFGVCVVVDVPDDVFVRVVDVLFSGCLYVVVERERVVVVDFIDP